MRVQLKKHFQSHANGCSDEMMIWKKKRQNLCQSKVAPTFFFALIDDYSSRLGDRTPVLLSQFCHKLLCIAWRCLNFLLLSSVMEIMLSYFFS